MEINTPHFNAIAGQFLTESKKSYSAKQVKKGKDIGKSAGKKNSSKKTGKKVAGAALKKASYKK
jgi:hypothetical protein